MEIKMEVCHCRSCGGKGTRTRSGGPGTLHDSVPERYDCPECEGTGHVVREVE